MLHYLKFALFYALSIPMLVCLTLGGDWLYFGFFLAFGVVVAGDLLLGDDESMPEFKKPIIFTAFLYGSLPLIIMLNFIMLWVIAGGDPLGYGAMIESLTGYDALAARETNTIAGLLVAIFGYGFMNGIISMILGHELTHRTWDPVSLFIGRWLLSFSWDAGFSIEHVYGHHAYVGSIDDPATAPRGRNVYQHVVISTYEGNVSAAKIEAERLTKKRFGVWSLHNRYIRGLLMSVAITLAAFAIAGWMGALVFTFAALFGKALLEIINFAEHYGIVRNPKTPVQPYHSWNTNVGTSSWATFNLTRHSHHHAEGDVPFHKLKPYKDVPMMVTGLMSTVYLTLIPPLWNKLMIPKVLEWDKKYASDEELALANEANQNSGLKGFQKVSY